MDLPSVLRLPSRSSITFRLTILFAGTTFVILLLSAAALYWSLARSLRAEDARLLRENATLLQQASRRRPDRPSTVRDEILLEPAAGRLEPFYARIVDRDGRAVVETPGMAELLASSRFAAAGPGDVTSWRSPAGRTFLILSRPIAGGAGERLQVALDVTHDARILAGYRRVLAAVLALATLLATAIGLLLARRGLAPIDEITRAVRRITARRLDRRIGGGRWPEELADLARVFDQMLGRLEESFTRLSRFGADLAHELRTPLTNLRGEAEVALGRGRTPDEYRHILESSLEEYGRLTELIDRLLFLARAESGAAALERRLVEVREEVDTVLAFYAVLADENDVTLECTGRARAFLDPTLFRRALANLLSNAVAYTPRGGTVSVSIEAPGPSTRVEVRDDGCGIAAEHLKRVTDRFYRVDPAREGNGAGAGLGLSLVRTITELHGGSMDLSSRPSVGTTVSLDFPAPPADSHITLP